MSTDLPSTFLQLRSLIRNTGELELSLAEVPLPEPQHDQVLVRVQAAPINPSDLGLLTSAADMSEARASGTAERPVITARVPSKALRALTARLDQSLPVGNEGAGVVVKAGASASAQALLGKTVAALGGEMYGEYRCLHVTQCMPLPADATAADGASCFINPLTSLGMVDTMRREGHKALVHTAAASNLGQMLNRICLDDGVPLVNIVRKRDQAELLKSQGAKFVCNSEDDGFMESLVEAIAATGATLAFDAIGGGRLAGQILTAMEIAINRTAKEYSRYGSSVHKQVYVYGALDTGPTELNRAFGMAWGVGGWLLMPFLQKIGQPAVQKLREQVMAELKTTFKSHYTQTISLREALRLDVLAAYSRRATGEKYLIDPSR